MLREKKSERETGLGELFIFSWIFFRHRAVWIPGDKVTVG